jgi:hypothetical protein
MLGVFVPALSLVRHEATMQLNIPILPAVIFATGVFLVVMANAVFYTMLGELNGKRSREDQISMLLVGPRLFEIVEAHRNLFPASRKRVVALVLGISGIVLGFSVLLISIA